MNLPTSSNVLNTPTNITDWHTVSPQEAVELLNSQADHGLTNNEVTQRQQYFGRIKINGWKE
jgi:hypothetical protein